MARSEQVASEGDDSWTTAVWGRIKVILTNYLHTHLLVNRFRRLTKITKEKRKRKNKGLLVKNGPHTRTLLHMLTHERSLRIGDPLMPPNRRVDPMAL